MDVVSGGKSLAGDSSNTRKRYAREIYATSVGEKQLELSKEIVSFLDADLREDVLYSHDDPLVILVSIN